MRSRAAFGILAVVALSGCGVSIGRPQVEGDPCPRSVAEALAAELGDDAFIATGHVIRFIPAPQPQFRGYEINVALNGKANYDTYVLRMPASIRGFDGGEPVLLVANRTDRTHTLVPGACIPLTEVPEDQVEYAD